MDIEVVHFLDPEENENFNWNLSKEIWKVLESNKINAEVLVIKEGNIFYKGRKIENLILKVEVVQSFRGNVERLYDEYKLWVDDIMSIKQINLRWKFILEIKTKDLWKVYISPEKLSVNLNDKKSIEAIVIQFDKQILKILDILDEDNWIAKVELKNKERIITFIDFSSSDFKIFIKNFLILWEGIEGFIDIIKFNDFWGVGIFCSKQDKKRMPVKFIFGKDKNITLEYTDFKDVLYYEVEEYKMFDIIKIGTLKWEDIFLMFKDRFNHIFYLNKLLSDYKNLKMLKIGDERKKILIGAQREKDLVNVYICFNIFEQKILKEKILLFWKSVEEIYDDLCM